MRRLLVVFAVVIHLVLADAVTKELASGLLKSSDPFTVIPGFFDLAYVENRGCAWGMFQGQVWPLAAFAAVALAFLVWKRKVVFSGGRAAAVAEVLLYAGIVGNLVDRMFRGFVPDPMLVREAYILAGPTASGKSDIAAALAREMGAWILSADSMLVYRGMDIGTAKPSPAEREEFHMGGVDVVTPAEEFSSGAWLRASAEWAAHVPREVPIVIVGGTGLYFSALLRGLDRRWEKPPPEYPVIRIDRAVVRARIAARLDGMFMAGLEEEKRRLRAEYPSWSRTASLAIGYREGDDRAKILTRTCQLAKRQDTWFRHQATPIYVEPTVDAVRECWRERGPWSVSFA